MNRWILTAAILMTLALHATAFACPSCKESIPNTDAASTAGVPAGFNLSVYTMLLSLFGVMGMIGFVMVKAIRSSTLPAPTPVESNVADPASTADSHQD